MLKNVEFEQTSTRFGVDIFFQIGNRRIINLPLSFWSSNFSVRGEKPAGGIAAATNESFPLPPARPENQLNSPGSVTRIIRVTGGILGGKAACLEMESGKKSGEPLTLFLARGIFGDGPTQAAIFGDRSEVITSFEEGAFLNIELARNGQLYADITIVK